MQLPIQLKQAIEQEAAKIGLANLIKASAALSDNYRFRQSDDDKFIFTDAHRVAYLATRMPATFAAISKVLQKIKNLIPDLQMTSLLDLGAGPGTAAWAAISNFPELQKITLLERDPHLIRIGQSLAEKSEIEILQQAQWITQNLITTNSFSSREMIICSYSLGEMPVKAARAIVAKAFSAAEKILIVIEPGTMKGFNLIRELRDELIKSGGHVIAPCPHQLGCPMLPNDWCHFGARVERSALHRKLKSGELNYEDEKFSYLAIAKEPVKSASARILRRPQINPGMVELRLCTASGLQNISIGKSDKENFKRARKSDWGGIFF